MDIKLSSTFVNEPEKLFQVAFSLTNFSTVDFGKQVKFPDGEGEFTILGCKLLVALDRGHGHAFCAHKVHSLVLNMSRFIFRRVDSMWI